MFSRVATWEAMIELAYRTWPFSVYSLKIWRRSSNDDCSPLSCDSWLARTIRSRAARIASLGVWCLWSSAVYFFFGWIVVVLSKSLFFVGGNRSGSMPRSGDEIVGIEPSGRRSMSDSGGELGGIGSCEMGSMLVMGEPRLWLWAVLKKWT
ncbi:hypothetical protein K402DRAFT_85742 [Aulographum hederae CBS 113979]|uniref:Uncharacterized protein n=1 Tax=Aulographum hederae CBS 113979 TaxID=1176131 RepID=A0A6G1H0V8_9PEZI|nr:hypothetical protein K402DRAFT_85742 [Aulographum hederae CBS 113979]